ncbi:MULTISPECIES: pilus assembly protein TadG-related protein [unclassified Paenibacillus]|uniref:pilus assembly protein TadG-related protein n=1 Tax=unclassified Paenibacillus TaxID=185978 RepID=UPI002789EEAB|nr:MULTISPECIES: pilus assembly protein TadG-related protein [unclassified Paenibacillus]MDQ0902279.1 2C-methyl-D-erythritol 2,4-cyclodiphosphate synthase [Paenibacillus sp. V4I7]MDQ0919225.1 2C-methyl-D-erythritol 2,4-cyclodiphosphate synthase [Paenibacillus sp. V4I5]
MKLSLIIEKLKRLMVRQDGNVAVLAAFVLTALLGMTAVVIEGGKVYVVKMHLQKMANTAVLSGAQELTTTENNVRDVANQILSIHGETASLIDLSVTMKDRTTAVLKKVVDVPLAKVIGFDKVSISVKATAKIEAMGAATGAAPIGIDESVQLHYGQTYRLKVDEAEATTGNFGIITLGTKGGSDTYEINLTNGYKGMVSVGDVIDTETGNKAGGTRDAVQARINRSPYTPGDMSHLDDPRILLVPVYKPHNYTGGQIKKIEITGFAYFYLSEPMDYNTKEVIGVFIQRPGIGFVKPGAVDRGAYVIKLTE